MLRVKRITGRFVWRLSSRAWGKHWFATGPCGRSIGSPLCRVCVIISSCIRQDPSFVFISLGSFQTEAQCDRLWAAPSCLVATWGKPSAELRFDTNLHWAVRTASILRTAALNAGLLVMIDIVPQVIFKSRFSILPPKTSHGCYLLFSIRSHSNSHVHGGFKCLALLVWCSLSWKDQINLRSGFCKDTNSKLNHLLIGTTTDHFVCRQTILYRQRIARHLVRRT